MTPQEYLEQYHMTLTEDAWFAKYWADKVTVPFLAWWIGYYGTSSGYMSARHGESGEYWMSCSFALAGFLAGRASAP